MKDSRIFLKSGSVRFKNFMWNKHHFHVGHIATVRSPMLCCKTYLYSVYLWSNSKRCDDKVLYSKHVHVALWINSEKKSSNDTIVCYPSPKRYENGKRKVQCNENLSVQKYIYKLVLLATSILQIFLWSKK